ncbi:MAG: hypothetical protein KJN71_04800 [Acidimicrobiia bacterium]|nr:hypothetical protein [Acidimicrobiia bacterium]
MATDLWFRNPRNYIRQLKECGVSSFSWDRWVLRQYEIDPGRFGDLWMKGRPWRALLVGDQGSDYIDHENPEPVHRLPTWKWGVHRPRDLIDWIEKNPDPSAPHMVVVTGVPSVLHHKKARRLLFDLAELQRDNPDCKVHIHAMYSYRFLFGLGFRSVDYDGRQQAAQDRVILPNGKYITKASEADLDREDYRMWINLIGERDFTDAGERCTFNVLSAQWAAKFWEVDINFRVTPPELEELGDLDEWLGQTVPPLRGKSHAGGGKKDAGDMIVCDGCSLQLSCKLYREGSVCNVPQSDGSKLAKFFGSKDSDVIVDGLVGILELQEKRATRALSLEETRIQMNEERQRQLDAGEIEREELPEFFDGPMMDPETTKIVGELARTGLSIARLRKPTAPLVVNQNTQIGPGMANAQLSEQASTAQVVSMLESKGWELTEGQPNSITEELIEQVKITGKVPPIPANLPAAIEAANVIEDEEE